MEIHTVILERPGARRLLSEIQGKHNFGSAAPSLAEKPFIKEGAMLINDGDRKAVVRLADKGYVYKSSVV